MYQRTCAAMWAVIACIVIAGTSSATTVQFDTSLGVFDVDLFDKTAPVTVTNFLSYVNEGLYEDSIVHRSVPNFVIQGGGYYSDMTDVPSSPPIQNEFSTSNTRGTIAMAKQGGNPHSATSQWFINLVDNSSNLDVQNGGFTVFGEIDEAGMAIVDQIAGIPTEPRGGPFQDMPVLASGDPVVINSIQVLVPEPATLLPATVCFGLLVLNRRRRNRTMVT